MPHAGFRVLIMLISLATAAAARGEELDVPRDKIAGEEPGNMVHRYLIQQVQEAVRQWNADYETLKTAEQVAAYQKRVRQKCLAAIGGLPERTPLEPRVTGTIARSGYRVEKIIFRSQPKHAVTALLFLPAAARFRPPYPGVIVPCGHFFAAKGAPEYQTMGALLALGGMAAPRVRPDRPG